MEMPATGEDGKAVSDYFEATIKTVYVKEIKAPDSYAQSDVIHLGGQYPLWHIDHTRLLQGNCLPVEESPVSPYQSF